MRTKVRLRVIRDRISSIHGWTRRYNEKVMASTYKLPSVRIAIGTLLLAGVIFQNCGDFRPNSNGSKTQLGSLSDTPDQVSSHFVLQWGKKGTQDGEFNFPIGIAVAGHGTILVSDFYNSRIQRFTSDGAFISSFATLANPGAIAIDGQGNLYVTHFSWASTGQPPATDRMTVYDPQGKLLRTWGTTGIGDGQFNYPGGIALDNSNRVYVADQTNHRVQVFDRAGAFLFKWGSYGSDTGKFGGATAEVSRVGGPQFVALDSRGNVYTTEGSMGRIQKFDANGTFLASWGTLADQTGGFGGGFMGAAASGIRGPIGIHIDSADRLWVSAVSGRVQQFAPDGQFIQGFGLDGYGGGENQFRAPHSLVTDAQGNLYVVDSYNHRIQKFKVINK